MCSETKEAVEIAKRNALFWVHHIRGVYLPYLRTFSEVALQWLAPTLSNEKISNAADELETKVYESYPGYEYTDRATRLSGLIAW